MYTFFQLVTCSVNSKAKLYAQLNLWERKSIHQGYSNLHLQLQRSLPLVTWFEITE